MDFRMSLDLIMAIFIIRTVNSSFFIYPSHFVININLENDGYMELMGKFLDQNFPSKETGKSFMPKTTHQFELPIIAPREFLFISNHMDKRQE